MIERWTDELKQQLIMASKLDVAISNTAVGTYEQKRMEGFKWSAPKFTGEQWAEMVMKRDKYRINLGKGGDLWEGGRGVPTKIIIGLYFYCNIDFY
jgi:hypothetical protein